MTSICNYFQSFTSFGVPWKHIDTEWKIVSHPAAIENAVPNLIGTHLQRVLVSTIKKPDDAFSPLLLARSPKAVARQRTQMTLSRAAASRGGAECRGAETGWLSAGNR